MSVLKTIKCKNCGERGTPKNNSTLGYYCEKEACQSARIEKALKKVRKSTEAATKKLNSEWNKERKQIMEKLKTHKDYLNELQVVFNTFIRLRDKDQWCISCGCNMVGRKGDASHYYSVGSAPELRFNEDNCHLACVPCNQHLHGNLLEYSNRLPKRIGWERFSILQDKKGVSNKFSIDELKAKTAHYKAQIKILKEK